MTGHGTGRMGLARWLVGHTRQLLPPLVISVIARIVNQVLGIALLVIAATAIARAATGDDVRLSHLIALLVGVALVKALLRYLEQYAGHWVAFTALQRLRELLFSRLIPQAPAATQGRAGAELTGRATSDINRIEVFFAHTFPPAIAAVLVPVITLAWLGIAIDPILAGVLTPFVAASLVIPLAAGSATWRAARHVASARGTLAAHLGDDIQGTREILALDANQARLAGLDAADRELAMARSASGRIQAGRSAATVLMQVMGLLVLVGVAASANVPILAMAAGLAVSIGLWGPTSGIDDFTTSLDSAFAAAERVRRIVDAEPAVRDPEPADPAPTGASIELTEVTVHYPGGIAPAVDLVTARFEAGAWSYIVGVSGSGKSTLATLLLRGLDPDTGAIRLGGCDLRGIRLDELRHRIGFVSQQPTLLSGTLAENLRLAAPDVDDAHLWRCLTAVALDDWAAQLPEGLSTLVSERGASVSGGQLQRLALARALVAAPEVLVLDEALSQLDAATAVLVRERVRTFHPEWTVIEISHRADLIPDQASVLVLDGGRVVEAGPAGTLRTMAGPFTRLEARN